MIIGNGLLAKNLKCIDNENLCIFASGVSNSNEQSYMQFQRERELLLKTIENLDVNIVFIYFSSCGVAFEESLYFTHKIEMEGMVRKKCAKFYIFRLSQVVGFAGNKNNFLNFFERKINKNKAIQVWGNAKRNLIDIDDVVSIVGEVVENKVYLNDVINIASPYNISVINIIKVIECVFDIKVKYEILDEGKPIVINVNKIRNIIDIDNYFSNDESKYLTGIIRKYMNINRD